jgi:spermine oxidase
LFDTSAVNIYEECEANQLLVWNGVGYKTLFQILMRSYPEADKKLPVNDKICLNSKVESIS